MQCPTLREGLFEYVLCSLNPSSSKGRCTEDATSLAVYMRYMRSCFETSDNNYSAVAFCVISRSSWLILLFRREILRDAMFL